ncbi:protein let-653-like [Panonychus citri]|uniref:protein let-653-like n=1 Tax=Panonychus citri TaxID=50023 RepID=UPI002307C831|nr:protein let-653-like [Panonychus citri]
MMNQCKMNRKTSGCPLKCDFSGFKVSIVLFMLTVILPTFIDCMKVSFEKMTNRDFPGPTYFTARNISLYECLGWCRDEADCTSASFSFIVNPMAANQETLCRLQNETLSGKVSQSMSSQQGITSSTSLSSGNPQRANNLYFFSKLNLRSDNICSRLWTFERYPNRVLRGLDNAIIYTSNKEACLAACLNEVRFLCRSVEFNYVTLSCHLSEYDRRSPGAFPVDLIESQGVDYFENACLQADDICQDQQVYDYAKLGLPLNKIAKFVEVNYYPDKELLVKSQSGCIRACAIENEFICRSILYRPSFEKGQPNCALYHLDHKTFPDGSETFSTASLPLFDSGETSAVYLEASCTNDSTPVPPPPPPPPSSSGPMHQQTTTLNGKPSVIPASTQPPISSTLPVRDETKMDPSCDALGVCYDVTLKCTDTRIMVNVKTSRPFHGRIYALGRSETCNAHIRNSQQFQLDMSLVGQDCNTQSLSGVYTNTVVLQHHNVVLTKADKVYHVRCTYETTSRNVSFGMMPVRDPDTLQITSSPEAPLPKILIYGSDGREASTVRIGDRLTFRIQIPESTPYGIFARSCVAMAKDARSTFEIIDDHGCPVDNSIFPSFMENGNALESNYEAFRFTESYGVIFQCNVKYCIGKCEPVICTAGREEITSWGRKRRSAHYETDDEMTLSREILVLDFNDADAARSTMDPLNANESFSRESIISMDRCASRTSLMALSVISALLLVMYVCTVAYFTAHRRMKLPTKVTLR